MNKLYKPNGKEVTVNDNSLEYALSIGWNDKKPVKKAEPKKPRHSAAKARKAKFTKDELNA